MKKREKAKHLFALVLTLMMTFSLSGIGSVYVRALELNVYENSCAFTSESANGSSETENISTDSETSLENDGNIVEISSID